VRVAAGEIREAARGHRIGQPSVETAEAVARRCLAGDPLDGADLDRLAWALCAPVGDDPLVRSVLGSPLLRDLLARYRHAIEAERLWRVTWLGLLSSAMAFDPGSANEAAHAGWRALRTLLRETWPALCRAAGARSGSAGFVEPDWMGVLREHPQLLSSDPCAPFVDDFLAGGGPALARVERDLGLPARSWFWHALLVAATARACRLDDADLRDAAVRLVRWMRAHPGGRDEALVRLFERCAASTDRRPIPELRDFAFDRAVWGSPRLRDRGAAPAWRRLSDVAWRAAMAWLSDERLDLFFRALAARHGNDDGRRAFWARYAAQIAWSRLALGSATLSLASTRPAIGHALRDGDFALIENRWPELDALVLEIGGYVFVEFNEPSGTLYAYPRNNLPFDRDARRYSGGSADLKAGYYHRGEPRDLRIAAGPDRAQRLAQALAGLGIEPDPAAGRVPARPAVSLRG
jgi:hypothetical protein